jgi:transposase
MKSVRYIGLDVHLSEIVVAIADEGRDGEVRLYGNIAYDMKAVDKFIRKMISQGVEVRCVYEAGPCGYSLYRHLVGNGIDCTVVAPSQIPKKSGDRIKNDRRDALQLARLHRAGELTAVYVPDEADEALRDLTRAREDAQTALRTSDSQAAFKLLSSQAQ